jgi:uncharacterized protein YecE (DUF72 family)
MIAIGTAGWSLPRAAASEFPGEGSHLERYARVLQVTEINSSFHRPHARKVYERWAASTPPPFRFAVKLPRAITHDAKLRRARVLLEEFLEQAGGLGEKLGPLLVQLPPSLEFDARVARSFFDTLRVRHAGAVVCEPRHPTWFEARATDLLVDHRVGRVATDPSPVAEALHPGGWLRGTRRKPAVVYYRLHGSPRKYWSRYPAERLRVWADDLARHAVSADVWCIFDNTASGAAIENALEMSALLRARTI